MVENTVECAYCKAKGKICILISDGLPDLGSARRDPRHIGEIRCPDCGQVNPFSFRDLVPRDLEILKRPEHYAKTRMVEPRFVHIGLQATPRVSR